jgi:hypothetical protein
VIFLLVVPEKTGTPAMGRDWLRKSPAGIIPSTGRSVGPDVRRTPMDFNAPMS